MTATEASRSFAAVLDDVERGETVVVTRGGRRIASIGPVAAGNGSQVARILGSDAADEGFADDVVAARGAVALDGPAWLVD